MLSPEERADDKHELRVGMALAYKGMEAIMALRREHAEKRRAKREAEGTTDAQAQCKKSNTLRPR